MVVPKSLKLNKFRIVQIPSAREIIGRFGLMTPHYFTGEDLAPLPQTKTDMMMELDALNGTQLAKELADETQQRV